MKPFLFYFFVLFSLSVYSQDKQTDTTGYWEDQLYLSLTYNSLVNQPETVSESGFSYGIGVGYIKDIPFSKRGKSALGIGLGYAYDSFNHGLSVNQDQSFSLNTEPVNVIRLHSIEFPIQLRWRNSTISTFSFWRIYTGVRLSYNFSNLYTSTAADIYNIESYNTFQSGLELSVGYGTFSAYVYYGLSSMYTNATLSNNPIATRMIKFGLIFYLL